MIASQASQCAGKHPYPTPAAARSVATRGKHLVAAYRCPHCGLWHVGTPSKSGKVMRRKRVLHYGDEE
jgi:hypothetical protein